jgi:hypothetical protein
MIVMEKNGKIILEYNVAKFKTGQLVGYIPTSPKCADPQLTFSFDGYSYLGQAGPENDIGIVVEVSRTEENEGIVHPDCHYCRVVWQKTADEGIYFEDELYLYPVK